MKGFRRGSRVVLPVLISALWGFSAAAQPLESKPVQTKDEIDAYNQTTVTPQQYVRLKIGGELSGTISFFSQAGLQNTAKGVAVRLIQNGKVVSSAQTDANGQFSFRRVDSGLHTIVAASADLLAAYALTVVADDSVPSATLDLVAANVPFSRAKTVLAGMRRPMRESYGTVVSVDSQARQTWNVYRVQLDPAGGFGGKVFLPGRFNDPDDVRGTVVRVLRNGETIAESVVAATGEYHVKDVGPGPASVLFFGRAGFAAMGIEFVPSMLQTSVRANDSQPGSSLQLVTLKQDPVASLNVELASTEDVQEAVDEIEESVGADEMLGTPIEIPPPLAGGGFAGAGAGPGFGGGGGGSGGLGGLAGLAAIGASLAAALSSGDDDGFTPEASSPATP